MKVRIEDAHCIACGLCREACPERAVHPRLQDVHHRFEVVAGECTGCALCLEYCPAPGALVQYDVASSPASTR
jgi:formate hydrogenlyase subunit 6/NADH:ubiquinone oxidoreductase subunit I